MLICYNVHLHICLKKKMKICYFGFLMNYRALAEADDVNSMLLRKSFAELKES
jgi:hypothetical protein